MAPGARHAASISYWLHSRRRNYSAELYRAWSRSIAHDYERDVQAEHDEIVRAALAHDADGGSAALRDHIERSTAALLRHAGA